MSTRVGIVVPTLGKRPEYLSQCLSSIREAGARQGKAHIVLVCPESFQADSLLQSGQVDQIVKDPGTGLPDAINLGFSLLPKEVEFINWLGDDDHLVKGSLDNTTQALDNNPESGMVFGGCNYVGSNGEFIWANRSGKWAVPLLRFGPDLIPQPGALFRRDLFFTVGGLDPKLRWAFDLDLFIKLSKLGSVSFVAKPLAYFRWHPGSMSVEFRKKSVREAHAVRISHLPCWVRPLSFIWEYPIMLATYLAGLLVTRLAREP